MGRYNIEVGRCKYCRREQGVYAESRYDADEEVTENCSCIGSLRASKFEKAYDDLEILEHSLRSEPEIVRDIKVMRTRLKELKHAAQIIL